MAGPPGARLLVLIGVVLAAGPFLVAVRRSLGRLRVRRVVQGRVAEVHPGPARVAGRRPGGGAAAFPSAAAGSRAAAGATGPSAARPAPGGGGGSGPSLPTGSISAPLVRSVALLAGAVGHRLRRWARRRPDAQLDQRVGAGVLGTALVLPLGGVPLAVIVGAAVWAAPGARRRAAQRRLRAAVIDDLPDVIDLIRLAVESGLNVSGALAVVAEHGPDAGPLVEALRSTRRQADLGESLVTALGAVASLGEPARPLHEAVVAAHRHGVPLAPALDRAAAEARDARRRAREEAARRLPVQLLFPLVFCTLPALLVLTVVPLLLRSFPALGP
jgi:tight adherence protein C